MQIAKTNYTNHTLFKRMQILVQSKPISKGNNHVSVMKFLVGSRIESGEVTQTIYAEVAYLNYN